MKTLLNLSYIVVVALMIAAFLKIILDFINQEGLYAFDVLAIFVGIPLLGTAIITLLFNADKKNAAKEKSSNDKYISHTHTAYLIKKELLKLPEADRVNPEKYANELANTLISTWESDSDLLRTSVAHNRPYKEKVK